MLILSDLSKKDPFSYVKNPTIADDSELAGAASSLYQTFLTVFLTGVATTIILALLTIILSKRADQRGEAKKNIVFKLLLVSAFSAAVPGCGLLINLVTRIF